MLAKVIPNHRHKLGRQQDFAARVRYPFLTADAVELVNLAGSSWQDAAFQMRTTAGLAPFLLNSEYHIVLTFGEEERPTERQIFDAGQSAVEELGGSEFQYVMAIHKNRINIHLHILCNRVHPLTGRVLSTSHDHARLELACRKIEYRNGWPQDRGRFDCEIVDDKVSLVPKPAEHWKRKTEARKQGLRPDGRAVRRLEQRTGLPPLRDLLSTKIVQLRSVLDASVGWKDIHQALSENGLQYELNGSGARISRPGGSLFMPAGQLGSRSSLKSLEGRLGVFTPADTTAAKTDPLPRERPAAADSSPLEMLMQSLTRTVKEIKTWRRDRATARKALRSMQRDERQRVGQILAGRRTMAARALRQVMTAAHREQAAELRLQHPAPHSVPFDATSHITRLAPVEMTSRRYRHVHRAEKATEGIVIDGMPHDHTACRQAWYAQPGVATDIARQIQNTIFRHSDDVRVDPRGNLLFARRNAEGSIVGFAVRQGQGLSADVDQPAGSGDGLCLIGSRSASEVTIVPDVISGLIHATEKMAASKLIIVAEVGMTPRTQHFLGVLRSSRMEDLTEQTVPTPPEPIGDVSNKIGNVPDIVVIGSEPHKDDSKHQDLESDDVPASNSPTPFAF